MKYKKTRFKGLVIYSGKDFKDKRGFFREIFKKIKIKKELPFLCLSYTKKNVLRGLHMQTKNPQGKYISVIKGKIFDVAVDLRKNSKTFGKYISLIISDKSDFSFYIPKGFAHGYKCIGKSNTVLYLLTQKYLAKNNLGFIWNDKKFKIKWKIKNPILSGKDKNLKEYITK